MRALAIVLIAIIAFIYMRYNMAYNDHYEILQVSSGALTWELLHEKNPIVVFVGRDQSLDIAFKYLYITKSARALTESNVVHLNKARFCVLRPPPEYNTKKAKVEIINPKYSKDPNYMSVEVLLNETKALVLPQHWMYKANTDLIVESYNSIFSMITALF
jgi:hypothetical protein